MTPASRATLPRAKRRSSLLIAIVALVLCALLAGAALGYVFFLRPLQGPARPAVWFSAPSAGAQVRVGEAVALHPVAQGAGGVVRLELWADGRLQEAEQSEAPGISPFAMQAIWRPPTPGPHTLIARAFDAQGERAQASITVQAVAEPDADGDGAPDVRDACPNQPGSLTARGCPDGDGDGIANAEDRCPAQAGLASAGGCPAPTTGDRDGDGVADGEDAAPDVPGPASAGGRPDGDGDGMPDADDACPGEAGEGADGCRASADRDDDGFPDAADPSPDDWGPPESGGCPDSDGDGVCDAADRCPTVPGSAEHAGCHELVPHRPGEADADGDGVLDAYDLCPREAGRPADGGCPPPGEGADEDGDTIPDGEEPPTVPLGPGRFSLPGPSRPPVAVELDALELSVGQDYSSVQCYACLAGGEAERVELAPLGERAWDIAAQLGGASARRVAVPAGEPLEVQVRCGAEVAEMGPGGGWGTYFDLGSFSARHAASDWDGHVIAMRSTPGPDGRSFEARYRLCSGSCQRAALPAPTLSLFSVSGDMQLVWIWSGNHDLLRGYKVYMDGSQILTVDRDTTSVSIAGYQPPCGSTAREFYVTAYSTSGGESPPSNSRRLSSVPCPRVVRVTFESLRTGDLGRDEWWADGETVGPISGGFWAQGSGEAEHLEFSAIDYGAWWGERIEGFRLRHNHEYAIQDIFDRIWTWIAGSMSSPYRAPDRNHVSVELGPHDSLTIGGTIVNANTGGTPSGTLFDGELRIRPSELRPGRYTVSDRNITLTVAVDVVVGPEAGDRPDLVITGVTQEPASGQLRIHVFNNAADLANQDVAVNLVRASTNEQIGLYTWRNVSIPSGGGRILQRSDLVLEPYDLRAIVDPDNHIDEMDERNNIFETTVVMRVEFMGVGNHPCDYTWDTNACTPLHCNDTHCPGYTAGCESEHVFWVWAGHGRSPDDLVWSAQRVRFPERGELMAYYNIRDDAESLRRAWRMEGNPRYTFDVEVPAGENLYIQVSGVEQDSVTQDDSMGQVFAGYAPRLNWGARAEPYTDTYGRKPPCDDVNCDPCTEGLWAEWRITRVH